MEEAQRQHCLFGVLWAKREERWRGFSSSTSHWGAVLRGRLLVALPGGSSAALSVAEALQAQQCCEQPLTAPLAPPGHPQPARDPAGCWLWWRPRTSGIHVLKSPALAPFLPSSQDLRSPCPHPTCSDNLQLPPLCPGLEKERKEHPELPAAALPSASGQAQPHRPGHVRAQQGLGLDLFSPRLTSLFTFSEPILHHSASAYHKPTPSASTDLATLSTPWSCSSHQCGTGRSKIKILFPPLPSLHPSSCFHHRWSSRNCK